MVAERVSHMVGGRDGLPLLLLVSLLLHLAFIHLYLEFYFSSNLFGNSLIFGLLHGWQTTSPPRGGTR